MASNPPCMNDDGNAAIFVGTNFDTGESVTVCPACMVSFCAAIVEGMTGVPVSALIDAAQSGEIDLIDAGPAPEAQPETIEAAEITEPEIEHDTTETHAATLTD